MSEPITVLLVDDHPLVRKGVRGFLETQPDILVVVEAGTGQDAVRLASEYAPDVVLMDLLTQYQRENRQKPCRQHPLEIAPGGSHPGHHLCLARGHRPPGVGGNSLCVSTCNATV